MIVKLVQFNGQYIIRGENLAESNFDAFHPTTEPGSDRERFDQAVKAVAKNKGIATKQHRAMLTTGVSAWALDTYDDAALDCGDEIATSLGVGLEL